MCSFPLYTLHNLSLQIKKNKNGSAKVSWRSKHSSRYGEGKNICNHGDSRTFVLHNHLSPYVFLQNF